MKIAILVPQKLYVASTGMAILKDLAFLLHSPQDSRWVAVFSVGPKNEVVKKQNYIEFVAKSSGFVGNNNILINFVDYSLLFFNRSYSYFIRNINKKFKAQLDKFGPDVIITSYEFSDLVNEYKCNSNKKIKVIALMDDPRQIIDTIKVKIELSRKRTFFNGLYIYCARIIGERYAKVLNEKYAKLVKCSDVVVNFSRESSLISKKEYPDFSSKIVVIPPLFDFGMKKQQAAVKIKSHIKNILFLGSCGYPPNDEAIKLIKQKIAPNFNLNKFNFIVVGSNCKKYIEKNVTSLGYVDDIDAVIRRTDVCIAPILNGGGIKTKVIKYFNAGKPIIGTSLAFEGYPVINNVNAIIENDINRYPELLLSLDKNYRLRKKLSKNAIEVHTYFSPQKIKNKWLEIIYTHKNNFEM